MKNFDYDLFVLGAGSGGVRASRVASSYGAKVGICEEDRVGGTCVIRGCIPKKLLVYASEYFEELEDSKFYGWDIDINSFSWATLLKNKDSEIDRLNKIYKKILSSNKVDLFEDKGVFVDNHTLQVGDKRITADKILIATGGMPFLPKINGIHNVITSNEAFHIKKLPKKILINGGGYIAIEFASIFNGLGSDVTILYRGEQILKGFDHAVRNFLAEEIKKKGIKLETSQEIVSMEESMSEILVKTNKNIEIHTDTVMFATGRVPNTK
ncbi:MAG: Glutathione amide reductase, partial [Alphaproteobacteria bacterium MarineAlpha2_Bin1]